MNTSNPPSIRKAYDFAWGNFKEHFRLFTAYMLTFFGSWVILEVLVVAGQRLGFLWWLASHASFFVVFAGLEVCFIQICLALHDGKQIAYSDIFRELRAGAKFFLMQLIYTFAVLIGLVFLIIPGVYLWAKYACYGFTFAEGNKDIKQSFQQSSVISQDSKWFLFWFSMLLLSMNIVGASILGIGLIVSVPLSALMKVDIYRQLMSDKHIQESHKTR